MIFYHKILLIFMSILCNFAHVCTTCFLADFSDFDPKFYKILTFFLKFTNPKNFFGKLIFQRAWDFFLRFFRNTIFYTKNTRNFYPPGTPPVQGGKMVHFLIKKHVTHNNKQSVALKMVHFYRGGHFGVKINHFLPIFSHF